MVSASKEAPKMKSFGFGLGAMKKHPEIVPLVAIITVAVVGVAGYCAYALSMKSDIVIDRSKGKLPPWERVNPEKRQKLIVVEQEYKKIPELEQLKKEMGER